MNVADTQQFMRERLFDEDVADNIDIDGQPVLGHIEEEDADGNQIGAFAARVTLVIPPDAVELPVPGQSMLVDGQRLTVTRAGRDAVSMTIKGLRNAS